MEVIIWSRIPCTMDAIAITVATPITTPKMVRPERSLLARSWSSAMNQASVRKSRFIRHTGSFVPHRLHRIELGGPGRRIDAEHNPDARAETQGDRGRPHGHARGERRGRGHDSREHHAGEEPDRATQQR